MIVRSASPDVRIVSAKSRCSASSSVSSRSPLIPMTAFIGVRISWLIAARNALFAWFAASAATVASRASANSREFSKAIDAWRASPTRKSRSACTNGMPPVRHTAAAPVTRSRATSGATISRSIAGESSSVPAMSSVRASAAASFTNSPISSADDVPDDSLAFDRRCRPGSHRRARRSRGSRGRSGRRDRPRTAPWCPR